MKYLILAIAFLSLTGCFKTGEDKDPDPSVQVYVTCTPDVTYVNEAITCVWSYTSTGSTSLQARTWFVSDGPQPGLWLGYQGASQVFAKFSQAGTYTIKMQVTWRDKDGNTHIDAGTDSVVVLPIPSGIG